MFGSNWITREWIERNIVSSPEPHVPHVFFLGSGSKELHLRAEQVQLCLPLTTKGLKQKQVGFTVIYGVFDLLL